MARSLPKYYVYEIYDPIEDKVCYVGKGHGKRMLDQVNIDKIRNKKLRVFIKTRLKEGIKIEPRVVYRHDSEDEVLRKERDLIVKYGRMGIERGGILFNKSEGGQGYSGHGKLFIVGGIPYSSMKELAEAYSINEYTVRKRISDGWNPEQAVGLIERQRRPGKSKAVKLGGKTYSSMSVACKELGVALSAVIARLKRGWTIPQAFGVEKLLPKQNRPIKIDGKSFDSLKDAAKFYNIKADTASARIKRGWTPEEAFEVKRKVKGDKKFSDTEVREIRQSHASGKSYEEIAKYYGVNNSSISFICRGLSYPNAGGPIVVKKHNPGRRLSDKEIREIRKARINGMSVKEIAERYNLADNSGRISRICLGQCFRKVGGPISTGKRRLSEREVAAIRKAISSGLPFKEIANKFGLHTETIRKIFKKQIHYK